MNRPAAGVPKALPDRSRPTPPASARVVNKGSGRLDTGRGCLMIVTKNNSLSMQRNFKGETMMKKLLAATAVALGTAAVMAAGVASAFADARPVLTVGTAFAPLGLDPSISGNGRAGTMLMPAYEPLVRVRPDGSIVPALAIKWDVSPDFKSVTFTLRDNARFSDGTPVTADAVKNSITYWVHKKGPFSVNLASLTSIDVISPTQVKLNFSEGNPDVLYNLNTYWLAGDIIGPAALKDINSLRSTTDGAGAYVLDPAQTVSGKTYTYLPNKYYYDQAAIRFSKIIIDVIPDANAAIAA